MADRSQIPDNLLPELLKMYYAGETYQTIRAHLNETYNLTLSHWQVWSKLSKYKHKQEEIQQKALEKQVE